LPAGSQILDLCTGNGAVAIIAAETSSVHGRNFAITGIDLADIDPKRFVSRLEIIARDVTFVGNRSCETLTYADGQFDAVVSQYGIEYSELDRSLTEAVRVLAPAGKLRLFMHAKEGMVVASTKKAIADADFLDRQGETLRQSGELLSRCAGFRDPGLRRRSRGPVRPRLQRLSRRAQGNSGPH
jgi:ubiquinone/menaquinone biosynthesis C-methylase UbiE